jgi:hypothetical protein
VWQAVSELVQDREMLDRDLRLAIAGLLVAMYEGFCEEADEGGLTAETWTISSRRAKTLGRRVSISMAETRAEASTGAAGVYRGLSGPGARQCRVVSVAQLIREGGHGAVAIADAEIARRDA